MQRPKFSIVMPVYKVEQYIEQSLKSVLEQTYTDFEVILVDDCSPDDSIKIAKKFAKEDNRIKIITQPKNMGCGKARNTGVQHAQGKYLLCWDPDDWVERNYLEQIDNVFENYDVDSVWVKLWKYYEDSDTLDILTAYPCFTHHLGGLIEISPDNINDFPVFAWNKAYKLDYVKENDFGWAENSYFEEVYFYYDFFMNSHKVYIIDEMLYYYRQRLGSIMSRNDIELKRCQDLFKILTSLYNSIDIRGCNPLYKNSIIRYAKKWNYSYKDKPIHNLVTQLFNKFKNDIAQF